MFLKKMKEKVGWKIVSLSLVVGILVTTVFGGIPVKAAGNAPTAAWASENGWTKDKSSYIKTIDGISYKLFNGWGNHENPDTDEPAWQIYTTQSPDATGDVVIPSSIDGFPVKSINRDTFRNNTNITSCVISEGIEYIGDSAFYNCNQLKEIKLANTLQMIDAMAFYWCDSLKEMEVPESVNRVARNAFYSNVPTNSGLDTLTFLGDTPTILYTSAAAGYSLENVDGVKIYYMPETTGWDADVWQVLDVTMLIKTEGIKLNHDKLEVALGEEVDLVATVEPTNATFNEVTWETSNSNVVAIEDGVLKAVGEGTAVITVTCMEFTAQAEVEVIKVLPPVAVEDIVLDKDSVEILVGETVTVVATVLPEDAANKTLVWTSEDETIATVENGMIKGIAEGETVVVVSCENIGKEITVKVSEPVVEVTDITLDKDYVEILVGETDTVVAAVVPGDATDKNVTWLSEDETIATVEDGVIKGIAEGETVVIVSCGNITKEITVKVTKEIVEETKNVPFTDVIKDSWYFEYIYHVYQDGLMIGNTADFFGVGETVTREEFVTVLWRLAGKPEAENECKFVDVDQNQYYAEAINWAYENGIVNGCTETFFGVSKTLNRQELATILYRYCGVVGEHKGLLETFKDSADVSDFAKEGMEWCVGEGIIQGISDDTLEPWGQVTREMCAAVFSRLSSNK